MFEIIFALILWTWGLTPLWVNIVASCILFIRFGCNSLKWFIEVLKLNKEED